MWKLEAQTCQTSHVDYTADPRSVSWTGCLYTPLKLKVGVYSSGFLLGFFGLRERLLALHNGQMGALR